MIWKTEEEAKVQECVQYLWGMSKGTTHKTLQTFLQCLQPSSLACFLHLITLSLLYSLNW